MSATAVVCPACGEPAVAGAHYCEACGRAVAGGPEAAPEPSRAPVATHATEPVEAGRDPGSTGACAECGGAVEDGWCSRCGAKAADPRDHVRSRPQPWVAGVCDRGVRRTRNEDAMALGADAPPGSRAVLVVCDGVSTTPGSDVASLAAAEAALTALRGRTGPADDDALADAVDAANAAVVAGTPADLLDSPPSCTLAAAVVDHGTVRTACVGDSRVYWVPDAGPARLLTTDDSWAADQVAAGVPREVAEEAPQAHAITRWLGADSEDHTPRVARLEPAGAGWVVACSDGLWNYCSEPERLGDVVRATAATAGEDLLAHAAALVAWANGQGGRDNITVALARLEGTT